MRDDACRYGLHGDGNGISDWQLSPPLPSIRPKMCRQANAVGGWLPVVIHSMTAIRQSPGCGPRLHALVSGR